MKIRSQSQCEDSSGRTNLVVSQTAEAIKLNPSAVPKRRVERNGDRSKDNIESERPAKISTSSLLLHLSKVSEDCPTERQYSLSYLLDTCPHRVTKRDKTFPQKIITLSFF